MTSRYSISLIALIAMAVSSAGAVVPRQQTQEGTTAQAAAASHDEESRRYFTDLELVTQQRKTVRFYTDVLKDRVVLINFIFTHCEGACPLLTHKLIQVKDQLGERFGGNIHFVSISIDPDRDTPEKLKTFARQQKAEHAGWVFLTGDKQNVDTIVSKLGQYSPDVEAHSSLLLAGNVNKRHWSKIRPDASPREIVMKLDDLEKND